MTSSDGVRPPVLGGPSAGAPSGPMSLRPNRMTDFHGMIDGNTQDEVEEEEGESEASVANSQLRMTKEPMRPDPQGFFHCGICDFKSQYVQNVAAHKRRHLKRGKKHYECKVCHLDFLSRQKLEHHICKGLSEKTCIFKCRLCSTGSRHKGNIIRHIRGHLCEVCKEAFPTLKACSIHQGNCNITRKHVGNQRKRVTETKDRKFITYDILDNNSLIEHQCDVCSGLFLKFEDFSTHTCSSQMVPSQKRRGKRQTSAAKGRALKRRLNGWDEEIMLYCCDKCEFSCPSPLGLINHLKQHSDGEPTLLKSPSLQQKRIQYAKALEKARKRPRMPDWNEETFEYECPMCNFSSPTPIALVNHKKMHYRSPNYAAHARSDPKRQRVSHSVQRDPSPRTTSSSRSSTATGLFRCDECDVMFQSHGHLTIHMGKYHQSQEAHSNENEQNNSSRPGSSYREFTYLKAASPAVFKPESQNCVDPKELHCSKSGCDFSTIDIDVLIDHLRSHRQPPEKDMNCSSEEESEEEPQDLTFSFNASPMERSATPAAKTTDAYLAHKVAKAVTFLPSTFAADQGNEDSTEALRREPVVDTCEATGVRPRRSILVKSHPKSDTMVKTATASSTEVIQVEESDHERKDSEEMLPEDSRFTEKECQCDESEVDLKNTLSRDREAGDGKETGDRLETSKSVPTLLDHEPEPDEIEGDEGTLEKEVVPVNEHFGDEGEWADENNNIEDENHDQYDEYEPLASHKNDQVNDQVNGTPLTEKSSYPVIQGHESIETTGRSLFSSAENITGKEKGETEKQETDPEGPPKLSPQTTPTQVTPPVCSPRVPLALGPNPQRKVETKVQSIQGNKKHRFGDRVQGEYSETNVSLAVALYQDEDTDVSSMQDTSILSTLSSLHRCSICKVFFQEFRAFHMHLQLHVPDNPWMCSVCRNTYKTGIAFLGHLNNH